MFDFKSAQDVNKYFQKWRSNKISENQRLNSIRYLRTIGDLSAKVSSNQISIDFSCPLYGFGLARACRLTSCQFYIGPTDKPFSRAQSEATANCKNCLINCIDKSKNGRLSAQEVSTLTGTSVSEVNNTNANAVSKVRRATIKENIEKFQIPRFNYLEGFCIACEVSIKDELEMGMKPEFTLIPYKHGWCSLACKEEKPKWQFYIEKEFRCDYMEAIAAGYLSYKTIDSLGNVFGVSNDLLKSIKDEVIEKAEIIKNDNY